MQWAKILEKRTSEIWASIFSSILYWSSVVWELLCSLPQLIVSLFYYMLLLLLILGAGILSIGLVVIEAMFPKHY